MQQLSDREFDEVFALMQQSFPENEYRPREEQYRLLALPAYHIQLHRAPDSGQIDAFIAWWTLEDFTFIEHFAVHPNRRGGGLGGNMLRHFLQNTAKRVCLEVEPPDTEIALRRIGFYQRCGFFLNDYPYTQPAISRSRSPIPLKVMTHGGTVDPQTFQVLKKQLYERVYCAY